MAGILGKFFEDDPGYSAPQGGLLGGARMPMGRNQKIAVGLAGLRDLANSFSGQQTDFAGQEGEDIYRQNAMGQREAANKEIQAAIATGDMNQVRAVLSKHATTNPEGVSHIIQALQFGQPKYE